MNADKLAKQFAKEAAEDAAGVQESEVFVASMSDSKYAYRGTFFELGMAIGLGKRVFIVVPESIYNGQSYFWNMTFFHHPAITHVHSHQDVWTLLKK